MVAWWRNGYHFRGSDSRVQLLLSGNDLGQVVHTHVPLPPSSVIWSQLRGSDWEGNRRSGIRHELEWFIHLRAQGLIKGDEHLTNTVWYYFHTRYGTLYLSTAEWKNFGNWSEFGKNTMTPSWLTQVNFPVFVPQLWTKKANRTKHLELGVMYRHWRWYCQVGCMNE